MTWEMGLDRGAVKGGPGMRASGGGSGGLRVDDRDQWVAVRREDKR